MSINVGGCVAGVDDVAQELADEAEVEQSVGSLIADLTDGIDFGGSNDRGNDAAVADYLVARIPDRMADPACVAVARNDRRIVADFERCDARRGVRDVSGRLTIDVVDTVDDERLRLGLEGELDVGDSRIDYRSRVDYVRRDRRIEIDVDGADVHATGERGRDVRRGRIDVTWDDRCTRIAFDRVTDSRRSRLDLFHCDDECPTGRIDRDDRDDITFDGRDRGWWTSTGDRHGWIDLRCRRD